MQPAPEDKMPKAYWIAHVEVTDAGPYSLYADGATEAFRKYDGRPLARGGRVQALEGVARGRNVIIEFDSREAALRCYHSPEYQAARTHRENAASAEIMILDGVDGAD
jgi:uncharacterized protein (DUF1330 family)